MELIKAENYITTMEQTVLPSLEAVATEGTFESFDGGAIRYYVYKAKNPTCSLVILHGFTESARKFLEMIAYFTDRGANVYIYDQRGHGNSVREIEDLTLVWVRHFDDYVRDLECFVDKILPKDLPTYLYAHSMGGAVGALYLERHHATFKKAVLSSPMIAPDRAGYPLFLSKLLCRFYILLGKGKQRIFLSGPYPGEERFEDSCSTSPERFSFYESYRRKTPTHQSYSATYRWLLEALKVKSEILKKSAPESITADVMVCSAQNDTVVLNDPQEEFARRIPGCLHKSYNAKHEIFNSTDDVMGEYLSDILSFFGLK